jgi:endonuclease/exonuclease/phosphatase family metal-dependent hydrolase
MLQEVENDAVLVDLQKQPELGGRFVDRALFSGNDPRGIDVAALSTVPFTKKISHKDDKFQVAGAGGQTYKFSRDCLEVHINFNGRELIFLGVHFKAKLDDDPQKRLAEAQRTRFIANSLTTADPSRGVLILGDFNDYPGSPPIDVIEGADPDRYLGVGTLLPAADAWTVASSSAPGGLALHDDQNVNPVVTMMLDQASVSILHDDALEADLKDVTDHAPVAATYNVN